MPYQLELSDQKTQDTSQETQTQAPTVFGANGEYKVQKEVIEQEKEEKSIWSDNTKICLLYTSDAADE